MPSVGQIPAFKETYIGGDNTYGHHLAKTIERSVLGGYAGFRWHCCMEKSARATFLGGGGLARCNIQGECGISCAKTAEPIELPFRMMSGVDQRLDALDGVHIGAT